MYYNDVPIYIYVLLGLFGLLIGKIVAWVSMRLPEKKPIFSNEFFELNKEGLRFNYISMASVAVLYIGTLYRFGIDKTDITKNLDLVKFLILIPFLVSICIMDLKGRIIPNRLNLTLFEIGLLITFIYGITNVNVAKDMILGMVAGAGIFMVITGLGWLIFGKEAMGLGDVKLMGALGLFYGLGGIAEVTLLAFVIGAIISIIVLIVRLFILKNKDEYIAFGPFIVLASIAMLFIAPGTIIDCFLYVCRVLSNFILSIF